MSFMNFARREIESFVRDAVRPAPAPQQKPDEGKLIERASEGSRARAFLEDPMVQDFFARAESQMIDRMTSLPLEADEGRRDLACAIQATRQLRRYLAGLTQEGKAAEAELRRLSSGRREFF